MSPFTTTTTTTTTTTASNTTTTSDPRHVMPTPPPRSIRPLPDAVVARIKSSAAVVSLTGVVLELLKNALDAKATRVEATVDFARGGCLVEDNGLGIAPLEFADGGGLGKLYYTSKYHANEPLLGRNGTFLASLAALSLLTIASRHHEYRSQNALSLHHSKVVERQLPASAQHEIHGSHGTRVTVRNLFGNMPVRVKQRSILATQKPEHERLCEGLKRDVVGLVLSCQGPVSVRLRDSNNKTLLNLNTSGPSPSVQTDKGTAQARPAQLGSLLAVLTQANYITVDEWPSWVPASASTTAVAIKGAISLHPAPSKHVQFISLGIRPLCPDRGHNELFDHVNRIFALSSFGTVDEEEAVDEHERRRRRLDGRFKKDGFTNRRLKTRKDVDRHPMFHLCISLAGADEAAMSEDQLMENQGSLQNIMDVMEAMLTQWLAVHHFRPRQARKKRDALSTASSTFSDAAESDTSAAASRPKTLQANSASAVSRKRKRSKDSTSQEFAGKQHRGAFAEWSRIKSGKSDFFNSLPARQKSKHQSGEHDRTAAQHLSGAEPCAPLAMKPIAQGAFSGQPVQGRVAPAGDDQNSSEKENDDRILWKDPSTGKMHLVNARTGCAIASAQPRPNTDSSAVFGPVQKPLSKSLRLPHRVSTAVAKKTPWLDEVLRSWENPVFQPSEQPIQQIAIHQDSHAIARHSCARLSDNGFDANTSSRPSRFSKATLQTAHVISQVDRKFILVKMQDASRGHADDMLVLIDQHAADERVQVESLFAQLCTPLPSTATPYQSQLGHKSRVATTVLEKPLSFAVSAHEASLLTAHAARFAAWGILYDMSSREAPSKSKREPIVCVTALPPTVAQRCMSDPRLLVSMLRETVWWYADNAQLPPIPPSSSENEQDHPIKETDTIPWVASLSACPAPLVQLIHSRACRSALMFNDELSLEECRRLVRRLGRCVFPFVCAHGRPSMVPLVGLGERDAASVGRGLGSYGAGREEEKGFMQAWKVWRGE